MSLPKNQARRFLYDWISSQPTTTVHSKHPLPHFLSTLFPPFDKPNDINSF